MLLNHEVDESWLRELRVEGEKKIRGTASTDIGTGKLGDQNTAGREAFTDGRDKEGFWP